MRANKKIKVIGRVWFRVVFFIKVNYATRKVNEYAGTWDSAYKAVHILIGRLHLSTSDESVSQKAPLHMIGTYVFRPTQFNNQRIPWLTTYYHR